MTSEIQPTEPTNDALVDPKERARILDESLLRGKAIYTEEELCEATGATSAQVNTYWQTIGLPVSDATSKTFTADDAHALKILFELAEKEQFDHRTLTSLIRSVGHTTERLALWQAEALVEHFAHSFDLDDTSARLEVLSRLEDMAPVFVEQMAHAWRRQMAALAGRWYVEFGGAKADGERGQGLLPLPRAVGFADIVSFTSQTAQMRSSELSDFVSNFEAAARDVVTKAGGRVVKTIGDAVLYIADDAYTGAKVALGLANAGRSDEAKDLPQVRVSLVWGRVLSRFGDVFGSSVNLAARLSNEAEPGSVLLDPHTASLLAGDQRFALTGQSERDIQGLGTIAPVQLQWAYSPSGPSEPA
ncbi:adenylate/guanylate cyclase domain-containing protein [Timonella sp. A28]|uniref:adenylate/guanylate cyclase domain-containing protein n=1 Tax=Timonella sp. A28 TaxID=3442640 RepID=UPI003EBAB7AC